MARCWRVERFKVEGFKVWRLLRLANENRKIAEGTRDAMIETLNTDKGIVTSRIAQLENAKRTGEQQWEYDKLLVQEGKLDKEIVKWQEDKLGSVANYEKLQKTRIFYFISHI